MKYNMFKKIFIKLYSFFIFNSKKRKQFRAFHNFNNLNNNKLLFIDKKGNKKTYCNLFSNKNFIVEIYGKNNTILITNPRCLYNSHIYISGNNNNLTINHTDKNISCDFYLVGNNNLINIGKNFSIESGKILCKHLNKRILIGNDCMFSNNITLRTSDSHTIYNIETNDTLNFDEDIIIGNKVWLTQDVTIGKGSIIPDGCVVGTKSFVNKKFEEPNCILAGTPAKVVKNKCSWNREHPCYEK